MAVAYASAPEAERIRVELTRSLLDLLRRRRADCLLAAKDLLAQAMTLGRLLEPMPAAGPEAPKRRGRGRSATASGTAGSAMAVVAPGDTVAAGDEPAAVPETVEDGGGAKASAADRRKALGLLLEIWRDLARDLACVQRGATVSVRQPAFLEELEAAARDLPFGTAGEALVRIVRAGELLEVNATPELVLDVLLVRWTAGAQAA